MLVLVFFMIFFWMYMSSFFKYFLKKSFILSFNDCKLYICKFEFFSKYSFKIENKLIVLFVFFFLGVEVWLYSICFVIWWYWFMVMWCWFWCI